MASGGSFHITVNGSSNTLTLSNVSFGDIWLCAGQSNMDSAIETYKAKFPELYRGHPVKQHDQIRIFRAERMPIDQPQEYTREHRSMLIRSSQNKQPFRQRLLWLISAEAVRQS